MTQQELETKLQDLRAGRMLIVPHDIDHAHQMLYVAMCYINQDRQDVLDALSKDYA
jgi:hypothetical protein